MNSDPTDKLSVGWLFLLLYLCPSSAMVPGAITSLLLAASNPTTTATTTTDMAIPDVYAGVIREATNRKRRIRVYCIDTRLQRQ